MVETDFVSSFIMDEWFLLATHSNQIVNPSPRPVPIEQSNREQQGKIHAKL
jgi:hypothetical protein